MLGLLALGQTSSPKSFDKQELRLANNLASQAAVAIEHAHLFGQAKRRVEELSAFQEIVLQLNTPLNLNAVFDAITESALKMVEASNLHIYLYNATSNAFTFGSALWRDGRRDPAVEAPRANGLTATVVQRGEPVVINQANNHELYHSDKAQEWGISAIAGFPLKHGDQILGAFTATYLEPHVFTADELLLLNLLAEQAAVAVRNAGLFAGSQRRLKDMAALVDMAKQVTGNLKLRDVLQTTVQILQGLLNARASTITMLSEDGQELVVVAAVGIETEFLRSTMKVGQGVSGEVVRTGELVYIRDAHSEANFLFFDEVVRSLLVVPLVIRDETIGTLAVDSARRNAFSDSDIQLMTIAAAQVSVAIANARFIEELEKRATELTIAYDELKESDRLKDELVQNVSHELRTPLTFVKGYVDLVLEGEMGEVSPRQKDALDIVADKTTDITRLIEDIVTLQRISSSNLKREYVCLSELVATSVGGHSLVAASKGIQIAHSLPDKGTLVWVDKARINQVIDNLIGNAMKFSPDGGTISVRMMETEDEVQIVIADEGIGVPEDKRDRIFERFYQVDGSSRRRFGGTGVGLALVKRIVDAHQGRVWLESEVGRGSTFYVAFPRAVAAPDSADG
jgi:signal transduction histidine kinase